MTVDTIVGDTAILLTHNFHARYFTSAKNRYEGEQKYFIGIASPAEIPREYYFKIRKAIPVHDTIEIRRALKINRYLKL